MVEESEEPEESEDGERWWKSWKMAEVEDSSLCSCERERVDVLTRSTPTISVAASASEWEFVHSLTTV